MDLHTRPCVRPNANVQDALVVATPILERIQHVPSRPQEHLKVAVTLATVEPFDFTVVALA
jgi:hypothetical protein